MYDSKYFKAKCTSHDPDEKSVYLEMSNSKVES
jgi:hypothetical protein